MKTLLMGGLLLFGVGTSALALDGVYVGGQVGHVALTGSTSQSFSNAIGFGVDLGLRTNPVLELNAHYQHSSHSGGVNGLSQDSLFVSADFRFWEINDFVFSLGGGPGFYFMKTTATQSNFGLNIGADGDVVIDESLRVGLGWRYHGVFNGAAGGNYWTAMMRLGYFFNIE